MFRIGNGYDVHKLVKGRRLVLGGCDIPFEFGLLGHSDADVLVHAIIDALLGASTLGDIGTLFPDTDNNFRDICSLELLRRVHEKIFERGYSIVNIDSIVIAQKPKLSEFIPRMKENISEACCISVNDVSIKATTEEHLGFTGNLSGIKSYSVCMLYRGKMKM